MVERLSEPLTGGCLCGGVRFEVTEPLLRASYCHCTRCQRRSGTAASAQARVAPGSLRIVSGEELVRAWQPDSGFAKEFCSECGSQLWSRDPDDPEVISVRLGRLRQRPGHPPAAPAVRRLRGELGGDPGRRAPALRRAAAQLATHLPFQGSCGNTELYGSVSRRPSTAHSPPLPTRLAAPFSNGSAPAARRSASSPSPSACR